MWLLHVGQALLGSLKVKNVKHTRASAGETGKLFFLSLHCKKMSVTNGSLNARFCVTSSIRDSKSLVSTVTLHSDMLLLCDAIARFTCLLSHYVILVPNDIA